MGVPSQHSVSSVYLHEHVFDDAITLVSVLDNSKAYNNVQTTKYIQRIATLACMPTNSKPAQSSNEAAADGQPPKQVVLDSQRLL